MNNSTKLSYQVDLVTELLKFPLDTSLSAIISAPSPALEI